jgi:hypothetical protein
MDRENEAVWLEDKCDPGRSGAQRRDKPGSIP